MIYIIIGIVVILILSIIYLYYEDFKLKVTNYDIETNKIKKDYKIIQLSDFHNRKNKWFHKQIISAIEKEKPDIIVITGDIIDKDDCTYAEVLLNEIKGYAPIYYVPGNHEYIFGGYDTMIDILHKYNVNILGNKMEELDNNIDIYGIKDPISGSPNEEVDVVKNYLDEFKLDSKKYSILLSHRPEHFDTYVDKKFDLVFSGHAHGGQFILPFIGPIFSPHQGLFPKLARGINKKDNTSMIVSRGLGNSLHAFIRINNRPELVVVSLLKK